LRTQKHRLGELDRAPEAQEQLGFADIVLLNKTDLVTAKEFASVEARIRRINPYAGIHRTERCAVDLDRVLGRGDAISLERVLEIEPGFLTDPHDHEHDEDIGSLCLTADRPLDPDRFVPWVQRVTQEIGADILRMKGIVAMKTTTSVS
jgi:G3E family GTPase